MKYYSRQLGAAEAQRSEDPSGTSDPAVWSAKKAAQDGLRTLQEKESRVWKTPSDNDSFSAIKASGQIKMTPHSAGNEQIINRLVSVDGVNLVPDDTYGLEIVWWNADGEPAAAPAYQKRTITLTGDLSFYTDMQLPYYQLEMDDTSDSVNDALASCVSDLASQYDLLTDISELGSTLAMMNSIYNRLRHPMKAWHDFQQKVHRQYKGEKLNSILTDRWMEFRYGVMPLVYSAQDAFDLVQKATETYKTSRKTVNVMSAGTPTRDMSQMHIFESGSMSVTHRITGKARYSSSGGRVISQIGFNPFLTAWELVPLSFVVDWFVNIGDYIQAQTSSVSGAFAESKFCISTKTTSAIQTSLYVPPPGETCRKLPISGLETCVKTGFTGGGGMLRQHTVDSYSRILVNPSDVKLSLSPNVTLMRAVDAYSLTSRPLIKRLRTFK